ncbi:MAG: AbrB/MazE/SpoVT family DNA-binding domain-containing protein [bacterium]
MMAATKISSKGQITLPKAVRKLLKVHYGSVVVFEKEEDKIVIRPAATLKEFKGYLKGKKQAIDYDNIRKRVKEYVGRKVAQSGKS